MLLYQQQQQNQYHRQATNADYDYYYNGYYSTPRDSDSRNKRRKENNVNKADNGVTRSTSDANSAYRNANPHMHYIEAGYPRVPRWANWRSPYPQREGDMMPY